MGNKILYIQIGPQFMLEVSVLSLLMVLLLVVLLLQLGMSKPGGPKSPVKKFGIRVRIHWEKWLELYNVQWGQSDMTIKTKDFLYGEMRY